jgi:hypothetical protein
VALVEATELQRPEIDVPYSVVDFLKADMLANADAGNTDEVFIPKNAAVGTDVTLGE